MRHKDHGVKLFLFTKSAQRTPASLVPTIAL